MRGPKPPAWHTEGEDRTRAGPTRRTHETGQLILGHHGLDWRQCCHLMALGLAILAIQGSLAASAVRRLDREHRCDVLQRDQSPGLTLVSRLPAGLAATGGAALSRSARRRGITRRRLRGVLRGHAQALQEALHGGLQRRDTCFERTDIRLRFGRVRSHTSGDSGEGVCMGSYHMRPPPPLTRGTGWNHVNGYADPFYADWKFWHVVVTVVALILTQVPPLRVWLRAARLEVEVFSRIIFNHKLGNPNAFLCLSIRNIGGREARIRSINLQFERGTKETFTLPAQTYSPLAGGQGGLLLTFFKLKSNEGWEHFVHFFNSFSRDDEKLARQLEWNLRNDIMSKKSVEKDQLVFADPQSVQPLILFFTKHFRWMPDEYTLVLEVNTEPKKATVKKRFRFTLFESDSAVLRDATQEYPIGAGVYFDSHRYVGVTVPLTEA